MIEVPEIPLEAFEIPLADQKSALGLENTYKGSVQFGVIGSGQAGCRLAKSFYNIGYKKTLAINTAKADLNPLQLPEEQKLLIGHAEGSGKNMAVGSRAALEAQQAILDKMRQVLGPVEKIILTVGFGGGTGAGSLGVLIDISTKYLKVLGNPTPEKDVIVLAALPTTGELNSVVTRNNNKEIQNMIFGRAHEGTLGPIILIDNSRIEKLYKGIPPIKFWDTINDTITGLFQVFNYLASQESEYTTFDAADYKVVLNTSGLATLGVTRIESKADLKLSQALQDNLKKTLLVDGVNFQTAKEAACIVTADTETLGKVSMDEFNYGFDTISNLIPQANIHRGLFESGQKDVRAYTLVAGMEPK